MEFKYALSLLFSNMGYVLKIFGWVLISMIVTACFGAAVLVPIFDALGTKAAVAASFDAFTAEISAFIDGGVSIRAFAEGAASDLVNVFSAIAAEGGLLAALIIAAIFLYALYSFLMSCSYYPTAYSVNQLMSSNMRMGLASSMALNFKHSLRFALARISVSVPIDVALIVLGGLLLWGLLEGIGVFAFPIMIIIGIIVVSLRSCLFAGWLPRLLFVHDESMYTSLRAVKLNLKGLMKAFVITFFAAYALMAGLALPTFGLTVIVVPSLNYFLFRTIELVGYYKMNGLSFYTDAANVVDTVEFGYRAENQLSDGDGEER